MVIFSSLLQTVRLMVLVVESRLVSLSLVNSSASSFTEVAIKFLSLLVINARAFLGSMTPATSTINLTDDDGPPPPKKAKKDLMSLLDDVVNSKSRVEREMNNYLAIDIDPSTVGDPLVWWKNNQKHYPRLAQLSRKYLCVPATSVPSEHAFSVAGHIVNEKRACLLPKKILLSHHHLGKLRLMLYCRPCLLLHCPWWFMMTTIKYNIKSGADSIRGWSKFHR